MPFPRGNFPRSQDGNVIRVVVLAAIRPEGEEHRSDDIGAPPATALPRIARYTMARGDTRLVTEMMALGVEPMVVAVTTVRSGRAVHADGGWTDFDRHTVAVVRNYAGSGKDVGRLFPRRVEPTGVGSELPTLGTRVPSE